MLEHDQRDRMTLELHRNGERRRKVDLLLARDLERVLRRVVEEVVVLRIDDADRLLHPLSADRRMREVLHENVAAAVLAAGAPVEGPRRERDALARCP